MQLSDFVFTLILGAAMAVALGFICAFRLSSECSRREEEKELDEIGREWYNNNDHNSPT